MNKTASLLLGFLAGAAAGAITGVLIAPDKGAKTRKKLKKKVGKVSSEISEAFGEQVENLQDQIDHLKSTVVEEAEKIKNSTTRAKKEATASSN